MIKRPEKNWGDALNSQDKLRVYAGNLPALDHLFCTGQTPSVPLEGPYSGEFLAFHIAPGFNSLAAWLDRTMRPWQGKTLSAESNQGCNLARRKARPLFRLLFPGCRGYPLLDPDIEGIFPFRTYIGPARADHNCRVLKIDYDVEANRRCLIRWVLDELVTFEADVYLGKAYFRLPWGFWQRWAYFMLY